MFLDTANIKEIKDATKMGVFRGVTTNPTILLKENTPRVKKIKEILDLSVGLVYVQCIGKTVEERLKDCEDILSLDSETRIGLKVPMDITGLEVVKLLKQKNPDHRILGTAIYSADQGIFAALAGCNSIAPYINRMSNNDLDPYKAVSIIRDFIDERQLNCEILGASFKNTNQVIQTLASGAHSVTIPYNIFEKMMNKELAVSAIETFNRHGEMLKEKY
ncbi:transaldolase family protein [Eubacterium callanderi]|nr:transaldolase family protein [Eubacterium callanderi]MBU5302656.1 transaldolase [Eubacterium callanderi]WPK69698.1 Transaldolase [Eubacterium callanderi]WPK73996.1 Transaldolase [Eubacterium callanderi]